MKILAQHFNNSQVQRYIYVLTKILSLYFLFKNMDESQGKELLFINFTGGKVMSCLMVSALDSRLSSLVSSPGQGHCIVFLDTLLSQCLAPWVPASLMQGSIFITLQYGLASHPGRSRNTLSHFIQQKSAIRSGLISPFHLC